MKGILQDYSLVLGAVPRTCADCPFSRPLGGDRLVCTSHITPCDVVRGHWTPSTDCLSIFANGGF